MLVRELIKELQELGEENLDKPVLTQTDNGFGCYSCIFSVDSGYYSHEETAATDTKKHTDSFACVLLDWN